MLGKRLREAKFYREFLNLSSVSYKWVFAVLNSTRIWLVITIDIQLRSFLGNQFYDVRIKVP